MDYIDRQAEESEPSSSDASQDDIEPKNKKRKVEKKKQKSKKKKIESSDEEENDSEDEEERAKIEMKGFIADEEEEEQEEDEKDVESNKEDSELDEDDLDLIDENLGANRKKKRIIQPEDSDDEDDDRTKIQKDLFGDGEDEEGPSERNQSRRNDYDDDRDRFSESGQSEDDGFIVHEGGAPRHRSHRSKGEFGMDGHALDEARDVFGVDDFNFDEFYDENEYGEEIVEDEEDLDDDDRGEGEPRVRVVRRKEKKSTLFDTMEPSELERGYLAPADKKIMLEDKPERFLLRRTPVTETDDSELEREADWIYLYGFTHCGRAISEQTDNRLRAIIRVESDDMRHHEEKEEVVKRLEARAPQIIKEVLKFIRNNSFEVPFIASYRKEVLDQVLDTNELWKVYQWDEKWCHLQSRKAKLLELMKHMHAFQTDTEILVRRPIPESDMLDVEGVQTMEQLSDVSAQFHMYYGNDLNKMVDWERHRQMEEDPNAEIYASRFKMSSRNDKYLLCVENGLGELASRFGLSARQFAENLEYRKHDVEQDSTAPLVAAADYCTPVFPDAESALKGAMYMLAREIARQPKVRDRVRMEYRMKAALNVRPTKQGREQMDEGHILYWKRYLHEKPVNELSNDEYLLFEQNKKAGNLEVDIVVRDHSERSSLVGVILSETPFHVDEFNDLAEEWNQLRDEIVKIAVNELMVPALKKELHEKLLEESRQHVIGRCTLAMYSRLETAAYHPPEEMVDEDEDEEEHRVRVLAICYALDRDDVSFGVLVDQDGAVMDYVRLPFFTRRCNLRNPNYQNHEAKQKLEDNERFKKFVMRRRPHLVVVSGENMDAKKHKMDLEHVLRDMVHQNEIHRAPEVVIIDNEAAKVYMHSAMAAAEHADYPPYLRQAVSLARLVIDPLVEYSHLWNQDEDIFCLSLHPLQSEIPKEDLSWALAIEFINRVNEVGVDVNKCLDHPNTTNLLQFVCGLGPRKAVDLLKTLKQNDNMLESRTKLVMLCRMGPKVFMNCAGFIKINTDRISERTDQYVEVLDGTRVHPETYEWARKMAVDALEVDDSGDPTAALEEILTSPEKLRDLDLDAFAEELQRQGFGDRLITLYDIRKELSNRYEDWRPPFQPPNDKQLFKMLTKESKATLHEGKLVLGTVLMVQYKRLTDEQLENKQPSRDDNTGQWLCQWCHSTDFESVSDLYAHMDENKCPGQPVGIKIKLDNGLMGYVPNKLLSDKPESFKNPLQRVKIGQPVYARVMSVNADRFAVDLSCRSSDLQGFSDSYKKQHQDPYWDYETEEKDKEEENQRKQNKEVAASFVKRVISHPYFKNVTYREAERLLANSEQGDAVIRPSSKSAMNLTVTWKVTENVCAHIDVREEDKDKDFKLGKKLFILQDEFEDLDEILARHIQPMASFAREITSHKYYHSQIVYDDRSHIDHRLNDEKRIAPARIPYVFSPSGDYPGKFLLSYQARVKPRHEYMTVTPNGIRFRQQVFPSLENLLQWFKVHYRDPPPNVQHHSYAQRR